MVKGQDTGSADGEDGDTACRRRKYRLIAGFVEDGEGFAGDSPGEVEFGDWCDIADTDEAGVVYSYSFFVSAGRICRVECDSPGYIGSSNSPVLKKVNFRGFTPSWTTAINPPCLDVAEILTGDGGCGVSVGNAGRRTTNSLP